MDPNPAILQHINPLTYLSHSRSFDNNTLNTNDFLERRNGLDSASVGQPLALAVPRSDLEYSSNQLPIDPPFSTASQLILTPPQSGDDSSTGTNSSAAFDYHGLSKGPGNNVSGADPFTTSFMQPPWNQPSMTTDPIQYRMPIRPPPLSPPHSIGPPLNNYAPYQISRPALSEYSRASLGCGAMLSHRRLPCDPPYSHPLPYAHPYSGMPPAPRQEGPPFQDSQMLASLVNHSRSPLNIEIAASIPKGFFQVEDKWTCYRRNYFSVSCAFTFKGHAPFHGHCYVSRNGNLEQIRQFAVSIAAKTAAANSQDSETRGLVQHTPKRDKATESTPTRHQVVASSTNSLNGAGPLVQNGLFPMHLGSGTLNSFDAYSHTVQQAVPSSYTFERIQFQKATANNGKRRAQQQYFHVVVNLEANIGRPDGAENWIIIASKQSEPMVVRGRSPGHYKDNRRDSRSSMDPDNHSGYGGDGGPPSYSMQSMNAGHLGSSANWSSGHLRYEQHNNHGSYGPGINEFDRSPTSPNSGDSSGSPTSPGEAYRNRGYQDGTNFLGYTLRQPVPSSMIKRLPTPITRRSQVTGRSYEQEVPDVDTAYFSPSLEHSYHNPTFDFSATASTQALCALS